MIYHCHRDCNTVGNVPQAWYGKATRCFGAADILLSMLGGDVVKLVRSCMGATIPSGGGSIYTCVLRYQTSTVASPDTSTTHVL